MLGDIVSRAFAQAVDLLTRNGSTKRDIANGMATDGTKLLMLNGSTNNPKSENIPALFPTLVMDCGQDRRVSTWIRPSIIMQDVIKQCQSSRSFLRQIKLHSLLTKDGINIYIGQLGHSTIFNLYASVCGVSFIDNNNKCDAVVYEWKKVRDYLADEYHHYDIVSSRVLCGGTELSSVKVVINLSEYEMDYEFEYPERQQNLRCFAKLVCRIVPKPSWGEQLMCYVKGDEYVTGRLKHYFIRPVFTQASIVLGSSKYEDLQMRLDSCRRLQDGFDASIDAFSLQLAEAGYFLTTDSNLAQCYECGGILQLKNFDFDVWRDHAYWHPSCPYLIAKKGRQFVEKVRNELKKDCDFNRDCIFTFKIRKLSAAPPTYQSNHHSDSSGDEDDDEDEDDSLSDVTSNYSSDSGLESEELDFEF